MKISIDTKEDSPDSIRHVIKLLSSVIGETSKQSNIFEDKPDEGTGSTGNVFGDIFGDKNAENKSETPAGQATPQEGKSAIETTDKEETPQIQIIEYD